MTVDSWHASPDLLVRFATEPERIEPVTAASLEQHLVRCETCRQAVAQASDAEALDALWAGIADTVDRRPRSRVGQLAHALRLDHPAARLVVATNALQAQAIAAVIALTAGAVIAARDLETSLPFIALAPLVVLAVVAVAFMPSTEPAGEIAPATPLYGFRLFVIRTIAVLTASILPLCAASFALPATGLDAFAWLLPSLAMAMVALALSTRYGPLAASLYVAMCWSTILVVVSRLSTTYAGAIDELAAAGPQITAALLAVGAAVVLLRQRDHFDLAPDGGLIP
jgi:hypothetical protein